MKILHEHSAAASAAPAKRAPILLPYPRLIGSVAVMALFCWAALEVGTASAALMGRLA